MSYVVTVDGPQPAWIRRDRNTNLPRVTFEMPQAMTRDEARRLKQQADICCGGTLRIVRAAA